MKPRWPRRLRELVKNLLGDHLAFAGVEGVRRVRSRGLANGSSQVGLDQDVRVSGPDFLENVGGPIGVEMEDQGGVEVHDQPFARRHAGRFLDFLGADGEFVIGLERVDEVDAFRQRLARDPAEERQDANRA